MFRKQVIHLLQLFHLVRYPVQNHHGWALADKTGERHAYD